MHLCSSFHVFSVPFIYASRCSFFPPHLLHYPVTPIPYHLSPTSCSLLSSSLLSSSLQSSCSSLPTPFSGPEAKDALHKYRNMTGEKSKDSFEKVLTFYLAESERRYHKAERVSRGEAADEDEDEDKDPYGLEDRNQDDSEDDSEDDEDDEQSDAEGSGDEDATTDSAKKAADASAGTAPAAKGPRTAAAAADEDEDDDNDGGDGTDARAQSESAKLEDLEQMETPESVLMAAVTKSSASDRTFRAVAAPWLRFLWEAYRNSLDVLRNNVHYELLYYRVARQAMTFCHKYHRRNEFKRLCNTLRNHLKQSHTWKSDTNINLKVPETFERHVSLRLAAVKYARDLGQWKEAYRVVKDVSELIREVRAHCDLRVRTHVNFLRLIAVLFSKSRDLTFHAAACQQIFRLCIENIDEFGDAEIESAANSAVLSALVVPMTRADSSIKDANAFTAREYQARREGEFKSLLNLQTVPTRAALIHFVTESEALSLANVEVRKLFNVLELEFAPDALRNQAVNMFQLFEESDEFSKPKYKAYRSVLEYAVTMRLLTQVCHHFFLSSLSKGWGQRGLKTQRRNWQCKQR